MLFRVFFFEFSKKVRTFAAVALMIPSTDMILKRMFQLRRLLLGLA